MALELNPSGSSLRYNDNEPDCYVSIGHWMWTQFLVLFLVAIPILGWIGLVILAFVGKNATRKNYFRAILLKFLLIALVFGTISVSKWPQIKKYLDRNQPVQQRAR